MKKARNIVDKMLLARLLLSIYVCLCVIVCMHLYMYVPRNHLLQYYLELQELIIRLSKFLTIRVHFN